jgi:hypothetical protein
MSGSPRQRVSLGFCGFFLPIPRSGAGEIIWLARHARAAVERRKARGSMEDGGARFAKWGLGLFIFGVFLTFGIIAHYCSGSRWPTGELFMQNITLWWACPF